MVSPASDAADGRRAPELVLTSSVPATPCHYETVYESRMMVNHNPRRANSYRRNKVRQQVLDEEDLCWLCGDPVDKTLPAGHPFSAEIDEVIPVSLGGNPYDRTNCRLAHRLHNQQRGNGLRHQRRSVPAFTTATRQPIPE